MQKKIANRGPSARGYALSDRSAAEWRRRVGAQLHVQGDPRAALVACARATRELEGGEHATWNSPASNHSADLEFR